MPTWPKKFTPTLAFVLAFLTISFPLPSVEYIVLSNKHIWVFGSDGMLKRECSSSTSGGLCSPLPTGTLFGPKSAIDIGLPSDPSDTLILSDSRTNNHNLYFFNTKTLELIGSGPTQAREKLFLYDNSPEKEVLKLLFKSDLYRLTEQHYALTDYMATFTPTNEPIHDFSGISKLSTINDISLDIADQKLYVHSIDTYNDKQIFVYNMAPGWTYTSYPDTTNQCTNGLVADNLASSGYIYCLNSSLSRVSRFSKNNFTLQGTISTLPWLGQPYGLTLDPATNSVYLITKMDNTSGSKDVFVCKCNWSGTPPLDCTQLKTDEGINFTSSASESLSLLFVNERIKLTLSINPAEEAGNVYALPIAQNNVYPAGSKVTLIAAANPGYGFVSLQKDGTTLESNPGYPGLYELLLDQDYTITANFQAASSPSNTYILTIEKPIFSYLSSLPGCSETNTYSAIILKCPTNTSITITAIETIDSTETTPKKKFIGWSGDISVTELPQPLSIMFSVDQDLSIQTEYQLLYPLSRKICISPSSRNCTEPEEEDLNHLITKVGDSSFDNEYAYGTVFKIKAAETYSSENKNYKFVGWKINDAYDGTVYPLNPREIAINSETNIVAIFRPCHYLNLTLPNPSQGGKTSSYPGAHSFDEGAYISVLASANSGYEFSHWDVIKNGLTTPDLRNPFSSKMTSNQTITPIFSQIPLCTVRNNNLYAIPNPN